LSKDFERPPLREGFDDSRASLRRDDPTGWRFSDDERAAVWRCIAERRDIRKFRPTPVAGDVLERLLGAAHAAPSVGLSQPWRFVIVRSEATKSAMHAVAQRERLVQASFFPERSNDFLSLKIEGIREAPLSVVVCCDRGETDEEILGRHTIRDADVFSTCLAIENFWLAARAEGVGVGWVSFYRDEDLRELLQLPPHVEPVAWLCVGYPDERPHRPGLEAAGWGRRRPVEDLISFERWGEGTTDAPSRSMVPAAVATSDPSPSSRFSTPAWCDALTSSVRPGDPSAGLRLRDTHDELVKPAGSLGVLEILLERWSVATGEPPPNEPRSHILVFAADHGVNTHDVSLFPSRVSAQVASAAARGQTAIGVLARTHHAPLHVIDIGLANSVGPEVVGARVAPGTQDITIGPAMTPQELRQAMETGFTLASELARDCDLVTLGEIGMGNTTVASALLVALLDIGVEEACGRGTGLDAQGLERKCDVVQRAMAVNSPPREDPLECLRRVGGLEFAAMVGAICGAGASRRPVLLDGFATGVAALAAYRLQPAVRDFLFAGHCSAEPAHGRVLRELGLEPLLSLRLRLGEASGAALAFPLIGLAATLHSQMSRFDDAGVDKS
jgi:nicotinate-nucleotide--dimethylbenzimidazole phosphoribosyltransferase